MRFPVGTEDSELLVLAIAAFVSIRSPDSGSTSVEHELSAPHVELEEEF